MRTYQRKRNDDGTPNPRYKPDTRKQTGDRHKNRPKHERPIKALGKSPHRFIAVDGEGITLPNGRHLYVLLMASTGESVYNAQGLSTFQCFDFLLTLSEAHEGATFVGFGLSYDVNKWLTDLLKPSLRAIWESQGHLKRSKAYGTNVWLEQLLCSIEYRPRKEFRLAVRVTDKGRILFDEKTVHHKNGKTSVKWIPRVRASMQIWDVFGFFQCSFVEALKSYFPEGLPGINLQAMQCMKDTRSDFGSQLIESIQAYCLQECQALAKLMEKLEGYLQDCNLTISRWDGAGAIASSLLRREGVKEHLQQPDIPPACYQAQLRAYAGGRVELGMYGTYHGKLYNYDLVSAYPSVMLDLPSMQGGMWKYGPILLDAWPYRLVHVRWDFTKHPQMYYPFFYRDNDGSIYFPSKGEGWYHGCEALVAATHDVHGCIDFIEQWAFVPQTDYKPFHFVPTLFQQRKDMKANNVGAEKVLKLGLNSLYGKLAQSIGGTATNPPPFHNLYLAGYITAAIRAKLYDALMQKPDSIIMIATDGIYSLEPLDLGIGTNLGQWEAHELDGIQAVQAGVYFTWQAGKRVDHYRGFDKGMLTPDMLTEGWSRAKNDMAEIGIPSTRFVTLGSALASQELYKAWGTFRTISRQLALYESGKRVPYGRKKGAHANLLSTRAGHPRAEGMSAPFKLRWEQSNTEETVDGVSRETYELEQGETGI